MCGEVQNLARILHTFIKLQIELMKHGNMEELYGVVFNRKLPHSIS